MNSTKKTARFAGLLNLLLAVFVIFGTLNVPSALTAITTNQLQALITRFFDLHELGYLIDAFTYFLFPNVDVTIAQFTFIGGILLSLWLLIKGVNVEHWEKRALETV